MSIYLCLWAMSSYVSSLCQRSQCCLSSRCVFTYGCRLFVLLIGESSVCLPVDLFCVCLHMRLVKLYVSVWSKCMCVCISISLGAVCVHTYIHIYTYIYIYIYSTVWPGSFLTLFGCVHFLQPQVGVINIEVSPTQTSNPLLT